MRCYLPRETSTAEACRICDEFNKQGYICSIGTYRGVPCIKIILPIGNPDNAAN